MRLGATDRLPARQAETPLGSRGVSRLEDVKSAAPPKASFLQTLSAVLWSFFGVRKGRDHQRDMASLNPVHVIITGILAGVMFVVGLVLIVKTILG